MVTTLDPDVYRSAAHVGMIGELTGPFAAGAVDSSLTISPAGRLVVDFEAREPMVLLAPRASLGATTLRVRAVLDPDGAATDLPGLEFSPYTESGAFLPLYRPPVPEATRTAQPFAIALTAVEVQQDGSESPIAPAELAARIDARLVQGVMGRALYILGDEKARIRRQARELAAMRLVTTARDAALDQRGADLSVPRFSDTLIFSGNAVTAQTRREPDDEYRRRLQLYEPFVLSTPVEVLDRLNGPGADDAANAGPLAGLGVKARFRVVEEPNPFAFAIHVVTSAEGGSTLRADFYAHIRAVYLTEPAVDAPAERYLSTVQRAAENALRSRLRTAFTFPAGGAIAPALASALDRLGRVRRSLGATAAWPVSRAQDPDGGSRYQLGLGVNMRLPLVGELSIIIATLADANRDPAVDANGEPDPEIEAVILDLVARAGRTPLPQPSEDRTGAWLFEACGLQTVHRLNATTLYVSHLPNFGLVVTGPDTTTPAAPIALEALFQAPGDPGQNVILEAGVRAALASWIASGGPAWTELDETTALAAWDTAAAHPFDAAMVNALQAFAGAELPRIAAVTNRPDIAPVADVVERLKRVAVELRTTVRLAAPQASRILAGGPAATEELRRLIETLRAQNLPSVLALVTSSGDVLLVIAAVGLPQAGLNLNPRGATGFRWHTAPMAGVQGSLRQAGGRGTFVSAGTGITAVVVIGYARRAGLSDPYEFGVELPEGALLSPLQYEFFMNILERAFPIGVGINTYEVRQKHVDLDGDGSAEPLLPEASRTYRPFRRPRQSGEAGVVLD